MTVHFARCILAPLSLPQASTWPSAERNESSGGRSDCHRLPNCSSLTDTQSGSAATLRGEMGLFPFASTIGTMSTSIPAIAGARAWRLPVRSASGWWRCAPNRTDTIGSPRSRRSTRRLACAPHPHLPRALARPGALTPWRAPRGSAAAFRGVHQGEPSPAVCAGTAPGPNAARLPVPDPRHSSPVAASPLRHSRHVVRTWQEIAVEQ